MLSSRLFSPLFAPLMTTDMAAVGVGGGWTPLSGAAVDMDFATSNYYGGALANLLTTTRSSPALTYAEKADGSLISFDANTPRITNKGLLTEVSATNSGLQSQTFNDAFWTPSGINAVTANAALAPDGTMTADKIVATTGEIAHVISSGSVATTATARAISIYFKPAGNPKFGVREGAVTGAWATFDGRGAGEVIATGGGATSAKITALTGLWQGWYRVTMVYTANGSDHAYQFFTLGIDYTSGSPLSYTTAGNDVDGTFIWGFQAEAGTKASSYIPTTTVAVTRSADVVKIVGAGLTAMQASSVSLFAISRALGFTPDAGDRIIGTNSPVPLNSGSNTQVQNYNGSGAATATLPYSATFADDDVWAMANWTASASKAVGNGGTVASDGNGITGITDVYIGSSNGGFTLDGYIARVAIWTSALSDATMQALTAPGATFNASAVQAWGDSLTSGNQAGDGSTWPKFFAALVPIQTDNNGVGGETSTQIKDRFIAFAAGYQSPNIFQMGRNNFSAPTTVKADIATCVEACTTTHYLVGGVLPSSADSGPDVAAIATLNGDLATLYGTRFVDLLTPLQAANDGGANDLADVEAGIVPRSLQVDGLHLTGAGYEIVAQSYYAKRALLGL